MKDHKFHIYISYRTLLTAVGAIAWLKSTPQTPALKDDAFADLDFAFEELDPILDSAAVERKKLKKAMQKGMIWQTRTF